MICHLEGIGGKPRILRSMPELDRVLDDLHAACLSKDPVLLKVTAKGAPGTLSIGLGRPRVVLSHNPASGKPPYRISLGDPLAEGVTAFFFDGHHTEVEDRHLIPVDLAREALRSFCVSGTLLDQVTWVDI